MDDRAVSHTVALDRPDPAATIRALAPDGVDRIVEVSLSDNVDLDVAVTRVGTVIAAYATRDDRPSLPFWPMLFDNVTIRLLGSDDFPAAAKQQAAADLPADPQWRRGCPARGGGPGPAGSMIFRSSCSSCQACSRASPPVMLLFVTCSRYRS